MIAAVVASVAGSFQARAQSATQLPSTSASVSNFAAKPPPVCDVVKKYPLEKLSYEISEISPLCSPYIRQKERKELDRCGDFHRDPYASGASTSASVSRFTWASRNEMARKGKINFFTEPEFQGQMPRVLKHVEQLRESATNLCCGGDLSCRRMMERVNVSFCQPSADPDAPDSCVFGGTYKMPGSGYASVFRSLRRGSPMTEIKQIAAKNLSSSEVGSGPTELSSGSIVLSSYVPKSEGIRGIEPTLLHEFGHACSMVRMQLAAGEGSSPKALRATQWLDRARSRCRADLELPAAYYDFYESIGESRTLAQCLFHLTGENQKQAIDKPCSGLCPGHYLEESVGVVFSLLLGHLDGQPGAVFPQTCDHVRDGQHPMVSDVLDCLAQHSPRFRERLGRANQCGNATPVPAPLPATSHRKLASP